MRVTRSRTRAQTASLLKEETEQQQPTTTRVKLEDQEQPLLKKIEATESKPTLIKTDDSEEKKPVRTSKKRTASQAQLDVDPFPDWPSPTPEQCQEVHTLLSNLHGDIEVPPIITDPAAAEEEIAATKRQKSVLHSLVGTILSCNTTAANCHAAVEGLAREFPSGQKGFDSGIDYEQVRVAKLERICDAIRPAGLANIRGKNIKAILDIIYHENLEKKVDQESKTVKTDADEPEIKNVKKEEDDSNTSSMNMKQPASLTSLSLEHLRTLSTPHVQEQLMRFPGVGVKVAACVLLFNLHRPVFAVDTHIFRLSKWLGWVPPEKSNEITAFRHLQARIPDPLKYPLHLLLVTHGRRCTRCKAIMSNGKGKSGKEDCVVEHLMKRFRRGK